MTALAPLLVLLTAANSCSQNISVERNNEQVSRSIETGAFEGELEVIKPWNLLVASLRGEEGLQNSVL